MSAQPEHKHQLHQRVMHRRSELEATLALLNGDAATAKSARAQAVSEALAVLDGNLGSGWEHVGELEAMQLARWLENTPILVESTIEEGQAAAIFQHLEGRWHLETAGFPMQNFKPAPVANNAVTQTMPILSDAVASTSNNT